MPGDTEGKWIVNFPYFHKKSGVVQVDKKSTNLDQAKSSSREISLFFFSFIMDLVFINENRKMFNIHKHHRKVRW